jgi:hypothetical protein
MTNFNRKPLVSAGLEGLPHPEPLRVLVVGNTEPGASLPRPTSPNVADSGRIRFGAGFRQPAGK